MWKVVSIASEKYLVNHTRKDDSYNIQVTNMINIWSEEFTPFSVIQQCKEQNPLIEADAEALIQHIVSLIDGTKEDVTFNSVMDERCWTLEVKSKLAEVPFRFTFKLKLMNPDILCSEVTVPLLLLVHELQARQNVLCELLEAKDAEITEYKLEGAKLKKMRQYFSVQCTNFSSMRLRFESLRLQGGSVVDRNSVGRMETEPFDRISFVSGCAAPRLPVNVLAEPAVICSEAICSNLAMVTTNFKDWKKIDDTVTIERNASPAPAEKQESLISPPAVKIKEESKAEEEQQYRHGMSKKRKQATKPKLRL